MEIIKKVKVTHGEPLKGRVVKVTSKVENFETPDKVPTSTEINAKNEIGFDEPWFNPVFEVGNRFNKLENIQRLHRKNGAFGDKKREIIAHVERFKGYALTKYHPQISHGTPLSERDIRTFIDLQIESGLDIITILEPTPLNDVVLFEKNFNKFWEYTTNINPNLVVMPYITLKQENELFEKKLEILSQYEHSLKTIGIRFASMVEYRPNLLSLSEFGENDFWIHCSGGRKMPHWQTPNAQLHALQRFGVDTFSIEIPQGGKGSSNSYRKVNFFDPNTITFPKIGKIAQNDKLSCDCPICSQQNLSDVVSDLKEYNPKRETKLMVNDFAKVHEVFASSNELEVSREKIKEDLLVDYFNEKPGLKSYSHIGRQQKLF
ncbi:hypothetical protein [Methanobacterium formicicum]|uniref:hypothetical protein n=1 Tax=Methanobacterium formicicum TaxID=2162 RepID=UPI0024938FE9|nr:hypothetical protein [Methanobacterium formicicum]